MKSKVIILCTFLFAGLSIFLYKTLRSEPKFGKHCVFNTVFGLEPLDSNFLHEPSSKITASIEDGLTYLKKAQHPDGGWGAGYHHGQREMNPHAVPADPATTSMVAMALLRTGNTLESGEFHLELSKATEYLLKAVESVPPDGTNITTLTRTQIQSKLGTNIDLIMTTQYLSNLLEKLEKGTDIYERVFNNLNTCVDKIQVNQDQNGSIKGAGWAGVLQSSMANNALEAAQVQGAWVDDKALEKSRDYQKKNYDANSGNVSTSDGAGVVLYSVSGSVRASAKEARLAEQVIKEAKDNGIIPATETISVDNLVKSGMEEDEALKTYSAYNVYESAKAKAQDKSVLQGYGNNGGEEFLSFLQTGESMVINKDDSWKTWFDNTSGQLVNIQNQDGSWNGHHCITSPVFCTATCVLILSINNDIEQLMNIGSN